MTDNEIIKALECSAEWIEQHGRNTNTGIAVICRQALDLINRQQAEIEKLNVDLVGMRGACNYYKMNYDNAKAEIKRLKKENEILSINADTAFQDGLNEAQGLYAEEVKAEIISEAIKEFAERLKEALVQENEIYKSCAKNMLPKDFQEGYEEKNDNVIRHIDNLVKEMVGED